MFAVSPTLVVNAYQVLPREVADGVSYGVPLAILPVLGGMGLALWFARHHERRSASVQVVGLIAAPVLLLGGGRMLALSTSRTLMVLRTFDTTVTLDGAVLALIGIALIVAGLLLTAWSPFALLLPAAALLIITPLMLVPSSGLYGFVFGLGQDIAQGAATLLQIGAGTAVAVLYLVFTVVLLRTRAAHRASTLPSTR